MWGVLYADDVGIASISAEGLAKKMASDCDLTVSEKKDEDHAAANAAPCISGSTVRRRSGRAKA